MRATGCAAAGDRCGHIGRRGLPEDRCGNHGAARYRGLRPRPGPDDRVRHHHRKHEENERLECGDLARY